MRANGSKWKIVHLETLAEWYFVFTYSREESEARNRIPRGISLFIGFEIQIAVLCITKGQWNSVIGYMGSWE